MPGIFNQFVFATATGVATPTNSEGVIITTAGVSTGSQGDPVVIDWALSLTAGTSTTGVTINVRRGTTTAGTLVYTTGVLTAVAANSYNWSGRAVDVPGNVAGQQYILTVTQQAGTVAGTANDIVITVEY
jgi:hypothetical protein